MELAKKDFEIQTLIKISNEQDREIEGLRKRVKELEKIIDEKENNGLRKGSEKTI
jgi:hypothetical protein